MAWLITAPRRVMRSASHFGTWPPCSGRSALPALRAIESTLRPLEGPEGDGVAQAVNRGDAVLPLVARGSAQQIERARLGNERGALPFGTHFAAQPEDARC